MRFKIITSVYNAARFFRSYVPTIEALEHDDYSVVIVDDASTDGTKQHVQDACLKNDWAYILNKENHGALYSQVQGIRLLDPGPEDVLVFVDGDDRLAHPQVLQRLEHWYGGGTKLTYGSYESVPFSPTCQPAAPYPQAVIDRRNFRSVASSGRGIYWNHLRTFKAELFLQLTDDDFKDPNGEWYKTATDAALMYPCLELAAPHIQFIPEALYLYTSDNQISDWRKWPKQCDMDHMHILGRTPKR